MALYCSLNHRDGAQYHLKNCASSGKKTETDSGEIFHTNSMSPERKVNRKPEGCIALKGNGWRRVSLSLHAASHSFTAINKRDLDKQRQLNLWGRKTKYLKKRRGCRPGRPVENLIRRSCCQLMIACFSRYTLLDCVFLLRRRLYGTENNSADRSRRPSMFSFTALR